VIRVEEVVVGDLNAPAMEAQFSEKDVIAGGGTPHQSGACKDARPDDAKHRGARKRTHQRRESVSGLWGTHVGPRLILVRNLTTLVDHRYPWIDEHNAGVTIEHLDAPAEQVRTTDVVVSRPLEELSRGQTECLIEIGGEATVDPVPDIPDPVVLGGISEADGFCSVG
jgi:hypothetical protein